MPKWVNIIVVILIVVWIASNPSGAGSDVHKWVSDIFTFFSQAAKG